MPPPESHKCRAYIYTLTYYINSIQLIYKAQLKTTAVDQCAVQEDTSNTHNHEMHSGSGQTEHKRVRYQTTECKPGEIGSYKHGSCRGSSDLN